MASEGIAAKLSSWTVPAWLRCLAALAMVAGGLTLLGLGLARSGSVVVVKIDGQPHPVRSHATTVGAVLRQAGIDLYPEDILTPGLEAPVVAGQPIVIRRARPVTLSADGQMRQFRTQATTIGQLLNEAGVETGPGDEIWFRMLAEGADPTCSFAPGSGQGCGRLVAADAPLYAKPDPQPDTSENDPPFITLQRAAPITLCDAGVTTTLYTTAATVGQVLDGQGVTLFLADEVTPPLQARIAPGTAITVRRSVQVQIEVDGRAIHTRTLAGEVAGALGQEGIALIGRDTVSPTLTAPIRANLAIRVTRVREELAVEFDPIPFQTVLVADPAMEIDNRRLVQEGQVGLTKRRYRIVYHDDQEVSRTLEDAWAEQSAVTKTLAYGTKIVVRTLETPDGPIEYWRKMRVYTTSYTAASAGKPRTDPRYGYTRLGWKAVKGVVATDPTVIPLRTRIYIPGYGIGTAADTGGGVKGKFVDLCFDEGKYQSWHWWSDVYLLTPVPPASQIRWILPDWPKYPDRRR